MRQKKNPEKDKLMNKSKDDLVDTLIKIKKKLKIESDSNILLLKQQKEFKEMAEEAGSKLASAEQHTIRLEEENKSLKNEVERLK